MREKKDDKETVPLPVYESEPPAWLPEIHAEADLGYPGFYPPRPGQGEDILSAANVKNGFVLPQPVSVETFSAQSMINEKLKLEDTLSKLEELMNEVFVRRSDRIPAIPPSSFRMPTRVTLNDAKRQAWFADLANPDVPLYKLGKSVPHGAKGHDLLDLLQNNNVAIPRAVWVLRVFGANETAGLRNKPSYNPTQYSVEWANLVTSYLKKQLHEIALPSAPRPGLNIKQTFKGVLSDSDSRERWISRFAYCLKLLRTFYHEGLVDNKTFLVWLVQQMATCNLAQAGFIARLADEYIDHILDIRALARPLVEACLSKLSEICSTSAQEILIDTEALLKVLLQKSCLAIPDAFISPGLWATYAGVIEDVMAQDILDISSNSNDRYLEQNARDLRQLISSNLIDIRKRNEALSFRNPPTRVSAKLSTAVSDVKLLNSISSDTDLSNIHLLDQDVQDPALFTEKLDMLLTWSVTPLQYGDHRPLAAVTLIRDWRDKACERATRRFHKDPHDLLQDQLFEWLDTSEVAGESGNIRAVALLYGKLVKHELFSYPNYIQRLIARGESGLAYTEMTASRHRDFLGWIPLFNSTPSLIYQRKVTLHGIRARETPEDILERGIRKEIRSLLPELFGSSSPKTWMSTAELLNDCKSFVSASRYEQVRTFRQWLLPTFQKGVTSANNDVQRASILKAYKVSVELMDYAKCFNTIVELTLCMLMHALETDSMTSVIDTFHRYAAIWSCMDVMHTIVNALESAYQQWKSRGLQSRPLLTLLLEFDNGRHLTETTRSQILADINAFMNALRPVSDHPEIVPEILPEILALAGDPNANAPSTLANSLWIKYRMSYDWALKVWENTLTSLQQVAASTSDPDEQRRQALRYGSFLWRVDQHLPNGLDEYVLQWFLESGRRSIVNINPATWGILEHTLLYLIVQETLKTTTVLYGLVYPAWQLAASPDFRPEPSLLAYLRTANSLCHRLLLQEAGCGGGVIPRDLFDIQQLRTRRQKVYYEPHFAKLVRNIPLLVFLENNEKLPQDLRQEVSSLRRHLCEDAGFRQGAYRNLDVIREAFEISPYLMDTSDENLRRDAIAGLRMILWDSVDDADIDDWPEVSSLLSPWKLAATTIQMQFQVKQLSRALGQATTHEFASSHLDKLTLMLFHHTKTSEEAYYVGEMVKGADPTVAMKFIKTGLKCMKELLSSTQIEGRPFSESLHRVGELLRILIHVTTPFREHSTNLPALDVYLQEQFLELLHSKISHLDSLITGSKADDLQCRCDLVLLARLLQFILNFRGATWPPTMKETSRKLVNILFHLAIHYGSGDYVDATIYPLLIDTVMFIYDEIPPDAKAMSYDPFRDYPEMQASALPSGLPPPYRKQLLSLITRNPANAFVSDLFNSSRDSQGNLVLGSAVVNRPWEWVENLGEPTADRKEDDDDRERLKNKHLVKNSGSLSLEMFGARLTGDSVVRNLASDPSVEDDLRTFEDGLSSESIFARDWRETRLSIDLEPVTEHVHQLKLGSEKSGMSSLYGGMLKDEMRSTPKGSPASSVVSRSSARGSVSSKKHQSPSQASRLSNSTVSENIEDNMSTSSRRAGSSKRKAASDDEVEIVEGPVATRASAAAKRARSSKAPAGKTMASKTTASKTRTRKR